jgi:hypothetical protein
MDIVPKSGQNCPFWPPKARHYDLAARTVAPAVAFLTAISFAVATSPNRERFIAVVAFVGFVAISVLLGLRANAEHVETTARDAETKETFRAIRAQNAEMLRAIEASDPTGLKRVVAEQKETIDFAENYSDGIAS